MAMFVVECLNIKLLLCVVIFEELVSVGSEVLPIYVSGSRLYLAVDDGGGYGRIYRYDLGSGDLDEVWSGEGAKFSQAALDYINNRAVVVGLAKDSGGLPRSAVFVFNPSSESVDVEVHLNTDEINMFRSVVYDRVYRRFIVGERGYGTDASGGRSAWPNGGGLGVVPWRGYGADQEQVYVSATRLFGAGRCVSELTYGHRSTTSNVHHEFWSKRWVGEYFNEWYQANVCFLKLHYPRELWRTSPYDPTRCRYIDDETAKRIQDEFRYTYWDFLRDSMNMFNEEDRKAAEEELKHIKSV